MAPSDSASSSLPHRCPGRVLVVDDDPIARMIISRWMEIWDLEVVLCAEPAGAFGLPAEEPFNLAIIDYKLAAMNGFEVIARLRENALRRGQRPPLCALHTTDFEVREEARARRIDLFLEKPLHASDLLLAVRHAGCHPRAGQRELADLHHAVRLRVTLQSERISSLPVG